MPKRKILTPEEASKLQPKYDIKKLTQDGFEPYDDKLLDYMNQEVDIVTEDGELRIHCWMHDGENFTGIGAMQGQWSKYQVKFIRLSVKRFQPSSEHDKDERIVMYNHQTTVECLEAMIHFAGTKRLRIITQEEMDFANRERRRPNCALVLGTPGIRLYTKILGSAQSRRLRRAEILSKQLNK